MVSYCLYNGVKTLAFQAKPLGQPHTSKFRKKKYRDTKLEVKEWKVNTLYVWYQISHSMDNKISETSSDGTDSAKNKRIDPKSMSNQWCGDFGRSCGEGSHTPAGVSAIPYIGKQAGTIYEGNNIEKTTDGIQRNE